jgi:hypothetical protein
MGGDASALGLIRELMSLRLRVVGWELTLLQ